MRMRSRYSCQSRTIGARQEQPVSLSVKIYSDEDASVIPSVWKRSAPG